MDYFKKKSVISVTALSEETREGINKAYIPKFLYKPPYGYPRFANMSYIRWLSQTPYVEMCIKTIIDEIAAIEWDIVPNDDIPDEAVDPAEIENIRNFFLNPNTNDETFEQTFIRMPVRDLLEINSAVLNKVYNMKEEVVEIVARDAATFTKNPDIHGMFTNRKDIILPDVIVDNPSEVINPFMHISAPDVREQAAYFQFGWISGPVPVPFGRKEIIWLEDMKRTDDHYGYSPVQILAKTIQTLIYAIDSDLEYYNDNNMPKGVLGFDGIDTDELEDFKQQWNDMQYKKDDFGNMKKAIHHLPISNRIGKFERFELTATEMQFIEKQKWWSKIVWSAFGVTPTELGFTEDAKGSANQIVQSKVFRKKAINPKLRLLESYYNKSIVSEFGYVAQINTDGGEKIERMKYKFVFKIFDTDEERAKAELYKLQTEIGMRTVNEIRKQEGLDEVEWGDDPPSKIQSPANSFNIGGPFGEKPFGEREDEAQEVDDDMEQIAGPDEELPDKVKKNLKGGAGSGRHDEGGAKPHKRGSFVKLPHGAPGEVLGTYYDGRNVVRTAEGTFLVKPEHLKPTKKSKELYTGEKKAIEYDATPVEQENPLIIKNERPTSYKDLEKAIRFILKGEEKKLKDLISTEMKPYILNEVKDLDSLIKKIKSLLSFEGLRDITNVIVRNNYFKGWDEAEKITDKNFIPEKEAIDFLSNYTFDNIKGMNDEIVEKLRGELQRGLMAGEGVEKLKARVTKVFDVGETRAEAIARTETNRSENFGKLHAMQKSGEKVKKYLVITYDNRTSEISKAMGRKYGSEDKAIPLDQNFKVNVNGKTIEGPAPPFHVNERDTLVFIYEESK